MRLETYNFTGNEREVNKKIGNVAHTIDNCAWLEDTSLIDPVFTLSNVPDSMDIINENYVRIPKWGRYYFVTDIQRQDGGILKLFLHCDVLRTFKNDINKSKQFVTRQEFDYNQLLADSSIPIQSKKLINVKVVGRNTIFNNNVNTATANDRFFVLQTMGAGGGD